MKNIFFNLIIAAIFFAGCHKADTDTPNTFPATEQNVIDDFTNDVALSQYVDLANAAIDLNTKITTLNDDATDANLTAAQNSWRALRTVWEQCEGFLFGPVEDNDFDPQMDTWPTDANQFDSLLASTNPLELANIQALPYNLRGFHPVEYLIFGENGSKKASDLTAREKKYMVSATIDIVNICNSINASWTEAPTNFAQQVQTAGNGSTVYTSKQDLFMAIVGAMQDICEEVGEGKMKEPFDARDPKIVESPYSGNSTADFKNNITGLQTVYVGRNGSSGISTLVSLRNKSLDNKIRSQITTAINSFDNITEPFEKAIIDQRSQIQQTMDAVNTLDETLEEELIPFIQQQVKD
ncbi:MAG TPA: imelysin family protein [Parafilimonas sp.]|nr:imelysin family protein [Parafilimonas sp.]